MGLFPVIDGGGDGADYAKRITAYSVDAFLNEGQLPVDKDRVFILPFGQGIKLEFSFIQFSCESVGYGKYAAQIGNIFEYITASTTQFPYQTIMMTDNAQSSVEEVEEQPGLSLEFVDETRDPQELERWAWLTAPQETCTFNVVVVTGTAA